MFQSIYKNCSDWLIALHYFHHCFLDLSSQFCLVVGALHYHDLSINNFSALSSCSEQCDDNDEDHFILDQHA